MSFQIIDIADFNRDAIVAAAHAFMVARPLASDWVLSEMFDEDHEAGDYILFDVSDWHFCQDRFAQTVHRGSAWMGDGHMYGSYGVEYSMSVAIRCLQVLPDDLDDWSVSALAEAGYIDASAFDLQVMAHDRYIGGSDSIGIVWSSHDGWDEAVVSRVIERVEACAADVAEPDADCDDDDGDDWEDMYRDACGAEDGEAVYLGEGVWL